MEPFKSSSAALTTMAFLGLLVAASYGQTNIPCTASMTSSFTPCLNFITNSTANGTYSPTSGCCDALKSLTSSGVDCLCLLITGSVPFQVPINRTLAFSLPRACKVSGGVPFQCNDSASGAPEPAPASSVPGALLPPPALAPESDATPPQSPPPHTATESVAPITNTGSSRFLAPSAANPAFSFSPYLLLAVVGALVMKFY